jgi:hypothetical protein
MLKSTTTGKGTVTPTLVPRLQLCSTITFIFFDSRRGWFTKIIIDPTLKNVCKELINTTNKTNNDIISTKLPITFSLTHVQLQYQDQSAAC